MREKGKQRGKGRPFVKGDPRAGRPKGCLDKVTVEAREAAAQLVDDPQYRAKLLEDFRLRAVPPAIEQMLWYYAKGKPKETHEVGFPNGIPPIAVIERVILNERDAED
jgi:hypothetical protein